MIARFARESFLGVLGRPFGEVEQHPPSGGPCAASRRAATFPLKGGRLAFDAQSEANVL
jgi:hypothetical protein